MATQIKAALALSALLIGTTIPAYPLQIGVGTHMGQGRQTPEAVRQGLSYLHMTNIRDEIYWDKVEVVLDVLSGSRVPSQINAFLQTEAQTTTAHGSILVLGYGNPLYENGARPTTPESRAAFARYGDYVVQHYGDAIGYVEIWNEWNLTTGYKGGTRGDPANYAALVQKTVPSLRASGFGGKVLIGGIGGDWPDWAFTKALVANNVLHLADGYSVHLYNFASDGQPAEMITRLERLQQILTAANGGQPYPVYVTEVGWPSFVGKHGSSEKEAASKSSVFLLEAARFPWLHGVWLYELFDSGTDKSNIEQNFGILTHTGAPKAGACMVRGAVELLGRAHFRAAGDLPQSVRWEQFETQLETYVVIYPTAPGGSTDNVVLHNSILHSARSLCDFPSPTIPKNYGATEVPDSTVPLFVRIPGTGHDVAALLH